MDLLTPGNSDPQLRSWQTVSYHASYEEDDPGVVILSSPEMLRRGVEHPPWDWDRNAGPQHAVVCAGVVVATDAPSVQGGWKAV